MITASEILRLRLQNQQIAKNDFRDPCKLVSYMGAMQAQNYSMVKWAAGLRISGSTKNSVDRALQEGRLLRTHLLRPTWHLVSAKDLFWMLELTGSRIFASLRSRHHELGLTKNKLKECFKVIENFLRDSSGKTRGEILAELNKAGIETGENNRAAHILLSAELNGLICSGKDIGKSTTYALMSERVSEEIHLSRDEAIALLTKKYFSSHGPATEEDFSWWSGLTLTDARKGIEMISSELDSVYFNFKTYLFSKEKTEIAPGGKAYFLPAFDEFIVSYKDRSAIFVPGHAAKAISSNGIFWPVIMINGMVTGLWKQVIKRKETVIETTFFRRHTKKEKLLLQEAASRMATFLNAKVAVK